MHNLYKYSKWNKKKKNLLKGKYHYMNGIEQLLNQEQHPARLKYMLASTDLSHQVSNFSVSVGNQY